MRKILIAIILISTYVLVFSQGTYSTTIGKPVQKLRTIDMKTQQGSDGFIQYLEYPKPGGESYQRFLMSQKEKATQLFPQNDIELPKIRASEDPPELLNNFWGNSQNGIPLDNHLAVNRESQIVTVVNTQLLVVGPTGVWQEDYSLDDFWSELGESERYFDPRVIYDPIEDRFIIAMVQESECSGSNIVFAFSDTNDPTGAWHLYQFDGCPQDNGIFADFPMIALSRDELFFTYNAVFEDSTWQTGFNETLIYQINKFDGYAGDSLRWRSWSDITHNNRKLRYICPVKYATEDMSSECYFLSNRSFDIQNDTVFLVHINGSMDDPKLDLTVKVLRSDQAYGVPPSAKQPLDFLQTNDARVLDAFFVDDHIQFVSSTMDPITGRSGVFHGIISDVSVAPSLTAQIVRNGSDHFAYPGIAYTGVLPGERDAIIIASHASPTRFPGNSAVYFNEGYSDWVTIKEGLRVIDMFKVNNPFGLDPTLERWGDYSGIQRQYAEEGTVYTVSSYGKPGSLNDSWIGYLRRPGEASSIIDKENENSLNAFPNPASAYITFDVEVDVEGKVLEAELYDLHGRMIQNVFSRSVSREGPIRFHYNSSSLEPGTYVLNVTLGGVLWASKSIVIQ